ncbi:MAG: hypothetical protein KGL34_00450 [Gammaproteobacteria bacterium]|nr:hypothetical protein [Gammaproteobacteria bacterium]
MAIKRTTKSRGTPVRSASTSAPMRHVEVRPLVAMMSGQTYVGWLCKNRNCGQLIALAGGAVDQKAGGATLDDPLSALKCPHCGNEDLYRWSARAEHPWNPKPTP